MDLNRQLYRVLLPVFLLVGLFLAPQVVLSRIGVGIGTGTIRVDNPLKPGALNTLPSITILNTGDVPGTYGFDIQFHEGQEDNLEMGMRPLKEWFVFEPETFYLEPGQSQNVAISLNLPVKVVPGQYFAYLEGRPVIVAEEGITSVGVAAAAKLHFSIAPSNIFQGIYYRVVSLYAKYTPWTHVVSAVIILAILLALFRRFFSFNIKIKND